MSQIAVLWTRRIREWRCASARIRAAAEQSQIGFFDAGVHDLDGLEIMFGELSKRRPEALLVTAEPFTMEYRARILDFMTRKPLPQCTKKVGTLKPAV